MPAAPRHPFLLVLGGGNMGQAIVAGALGGGPLEPEDIIVAEPDPAKRDFIAAQWGVRSSPTVVDALSLLSEHETQSADAHILLAIKPQSLAAVASEFPSRHRNASRTFISILAGTPGARIKSFFPNARIIRAMPNLPARIRRGATAVCLSAGAQHGDDDFAVRLFEGVGQCVVRIDESLMDGFTALAGSGPAYVFYLAEAMVRAAAQLGFDEPTARKIVQETIAGSGVLIASSHDSPADLRAAVTSKGGTTAAATAVLDGAATQDTIVRAILAARDRAAELGRA